jgi:hypothetical protein
MPELGPNMTVNTESLMTSSLLIQPLVAAIPLPQRLNFIIDSL